MAKIERLMKSLITTDGILIGTLLLSGSSGKSALGAPVSLKLAEPHFTVTQSFDSCLKWTGASGSQPNPFSLLVESFDRPESPMNSRYRSGSQSLFGRTYRYAPDATGLEGVPLQVWSTKSFGGSWQAAGRRDLSIHSVFGVSVRVRGER